MIGIAVMLMMLHSTVCLPASAEPVQYLRGDLSFDGKINAVDLTLMKRGLMTGFELLAAQIADVNADGTADRNDAAMLRDYLLTNIDSFPEQYYTEPETPQIQTLSGSRQMEYLSRGVSAVSSGKAVFVSWRLLADDPAEIAFNVYRTTDGKTVKLNDKPLTGGTNFTDSKADLKKNNTYSVKAVINGTETEGRLAPVSSAVAAEIPPCFTVCHPLGRRFFFWCKMS